MNNDSERSNEVWTTICEIEREAFVQICKLWVQDSGLTDCIRDALTQNRKRGSALRLLLTRQNPKQTISVFPELIDLAATAHSDIMLCRTVIKSIPLAWVRSNILSVMRTTLNAMADDPGLEEEAYQRYAELLHELDPALLRELVDDALKHGNQGIREVGMHYKE